MVFAFNRRLGTTAGCAGRTATARNSGSSTSPQTNTRSASSTPRTITTAGSTGFPQALSEFVRGESQTLARRTGLNSLADRLVFVATGSSKARAQRTSRVNWHTGSRS